MRRSDIVRLSLDGAIFGPLCKPLAAVFFLPDCLWLSSFRLSGCSTLRDALPLYTAETSTVNPRNVVFSRRLTYFSAASAPFERFGRPVCTFPAMEPTEPMGAWTVRREPSHGARHAPTKRIAARHSGRSHERIHSRAGHRRALRGRRGERQSAVQLQRVARGAHRGSIPGLRNGVKQRHLELASELLSVALEKSESLEADRGSCGAKKVLPKSLPGDKLKAATFIHLASPDSCLKTSAPWLSEEAPKRISSSAWWRLPKRLAPRLIRRWCVEWVRSRSLAMPHARRGVVLRLSEEGARRQESVASAMARRVCAPGRRRSCTTTLGEAFRRKRKSDTSAALGGAIRAGRFNMKAGITRGRATGRLETLFKTGEGDSADRYAVVSDLPAADPDRAISGHRGILRAAGGVARAQPRRDAGGTARLEAARARRRGIPAASQVAIVPRRRRAR